jgi:hypothetical protein
MVVEVDAHRPRQDFGDAGVRGLLRQRGKRLEHRLENRRAGRHPQRFQDRPARVTDTLCFRHAEISIKGTCQVTRRHESPFAFADYSDVYAITASLLSARS